MIVNLVYYASSDLILIFIISEEGYLPKLYLNPPTVEGGYTPCAE